MRIFLSTIFCLGWCWISHGTAHAGGPVARHEVLHFTSSLSDTGDVFAAAKAILEKICAQNGLHCTLTAYPPGRALRMLQEGESAGELPRFEDFHGMAPTALRVPSSLGQLSFSVLTHDRNLQVRSIADLEKRVVFYVRGNAAVAAYKELQHLIAINTEQDCAYMVLRKYGDACIMTKSLALKILAESQATADSYFLQDLFFKQVYLYLSAPYKHLLLPLDQSLKQLRTEEKINH